MGADVLPALAIPAAGAVTALTGGFGAPAGAALAAGALGAAAPAAAQGMAAVAPAVAGGLTKAAGAIGANIAGNLGAVPAVAGSMGGLSMIDKIGKVAGIANQGLGMAGQAMSMLSPSGQSLPQESRMPDPFRLYNNAMTYNF